MATKNVNFVTFSTGGTEQFQSFLYYIHKIFLSHWVSHALFFFKVVTLFGICKLQAGV